MLSFFSPLLDVIKVVVASATSVVLFLFAGLTLSGSAVALVVSTPLFLIFSPILVPATIATTLLASGLTAGATLGITAISLIMGLIKTAEGSSLARLAQTPLKLFKFSGGFGGSWGGKSFSGTFGNKGSQSSGNIPGWLKNLLNGIPAGGAVPAAGEAAPAPAAGGAAPAPAAPPG
ncbi:oleosin-B2-like [Brassica napus]|uniref:oleosin-B2-like n=1 Tax=Brassica napus TaxID=3708 RepID=UPI002078EF53|nr:oleosin-B2-like [Brassica napus]